MSGHSKWSQIKRQKAITDLKKGQVFSKFAKAITIASKEGGPDPAMNFKLRLVVDRAKSSGMPNENIERAIKRGSGTEKGETITQALYEAIGPGGSALLIEAASDNTNRALGDIKKVLQKNNGTLAESGSMSWMFAQKGIILATTPDKENTTLAIIDAGATDVIDSVEGLEIHTLTKDLMKIKDIIQNNGGQIISAEISWVAKQNVELTDSDKTKIEKLIEALEELDDVVNIYTNL